MIGSSAPPKACGVAAGEFIDKRPVRPETARQQRLESFRGEACPVPSHDRLRPSHVMASLTALSHEAYVLAAEIRFCTRTIILRGIGHDHFRFRDAVEEIREEAVEICLTLAKSIEIRA